MSKFNNQETQKHVSIAKKDIHTKTVDIENINSCLNIRLSKDISINCIDNLYQSIHEMLKPQNFTAIDIDASQVTSIDTAGAQLLLALKKQADICEWQFSLHSTSESFLEVTELIGLKNSDLSQ